MSTTQLYQHLFDKFSSYSVEELIQFNNDTVNSEGWGSSKAAFRTAILAAFSRKGLDLSQIVSKEDGFTVVKYVSVRLENNVLIPKE
ncbi:5-oxoprolinase [Sphingobacterium sp. Mn56C]|uniref:5-oxoprolinase n=1 Tax=Sphingobacterium sp. Mn56C TaxID=3395261 RepID=UPI003BC11028